MKTAVIIPSRMAATRFPGKPLAKIMGIPMIEHVYRRCEIAVGAKSVWIATCDEALRDFAQSIGAQVVMTSDQHVRCTDRVEEAARVIDCDVVVNVQGDEPVLDPDSIHQVLRPFHEKSGVLASNLIQKIDPKSEDPSNYNIVKVVKDLKGRALYMSREAIPTRQRTDCERSFFKQIGIMAFQKDFLSKFARLEPTMLEQAESVDMMRMIEHGYPLELIESKSRFLSVDVPGDVPVVEAALRSDPHFSKYSR